MRSKKYFSYLLVASIGFCSSPVSAQQVINTYAGTGVNGYGGDNGPAWQATFSRCSGVAVDGAGNVYVADKGNNVVRKINTLGIVTTFAGNDTAGYGGDGGPAYHAMLNSPTSVATDGAGNVYIADFGNNVIRIVDASNRINTYAGNDTAGYSGDGFSADHASLHGPQGIAIDGSGNLYIADAMNHVIRMVDAGGTISTVAGSGSFGYGGDGGAAIDAQLSDPAGVAVDPAGNIYIADLNNNVVRRVDAASGMIGAFAGNYTSGFAGDGGDATAAQLSYPSSVAVDVAGNVYITDQGNNTVRVVDASGTINRFAGNRTNGYSGDGFEPASAELNSPNGVMVDGAGKIYIADNGNNVIRLVTYGVAGVAPVSGASDAVTVYPNPSTGSFTIQLPQTAKAATISAIDVLGNTVAAKVVEHSNSVTFSLDNVPAGVYLIKVTEGNKTFTNRVVIAE